ncbi:uncharacterized protein LOC135392423 [Ornithodoros turicata]|uniref:uncharacterized protein LOC135392423 n=1 Tax=Ornithodoros turicata TaxID=34597 RepID=UPI003138EF07
MPYHCCVPVCRQRGYVDEHGQKVSFHRFPEDSQVRKLWIVAIKRDPGKHFQITKNTKVCSLHFKEDDFLSNVASGMRILRDGAVPSIFAFNKPRRERNAPKPRTTMASPEYPLCSIENFENTLDDTHDSSLVEACSCGNQEELQKVKAELTERDREIRKLHREVEEARAEIKEKNATMFRLEAELSSAKQESARLQDLCPPFSVNKFTSSADDISFYTGLPSYAHFNALHSYLDPGIDGSNMKWHGSKGQAGDVSRGRKRKLTTENQLFLVLVKLRLGLFHRHLGHLFSISIGTVSRILTTWIDFMYVKLGKLPIWAPRSVIDATMPPQFKAKYPSTRVIIDATEIRCEVHSSLALQSATYSHYKSTNTFKGLVGIAPDGRLTFVSELFTGCVSDREIVIKSGFLDLEFAAGDSVMADKGFKIADLLEKRGVGLNIPPFLRS